MGKAADPGNARADLQNCSYDPVIGPMAAGTVKTTVRGPAPPPRAEGSFGPPARPG